MGLWVPCAEMTRPPRVNVQPPVAQIAAPSATAAAAVRPSARATGRLPDPARRSIDSDSGVRTMAASMTQYTR